MTNALDLIFYIYSKFIDLVFNKMKIVEGVSYGWVIISLIVFGILVKSVILLPKGVKGSINLSKKEEE